MSDLSALSKEQLAELFAELSREQGDAMQVEDTKRYNRLLDKLDAVKKEIRGRGDDARKVLIPLLEASARDSISPYQAAQTRFNAAVELKAVAPELAKATLQSLATHGPRKYRGMAGMSLSFDAEGISKPT